MATFDELLKRCGLTHEFSAEWHTHFSSVTFYAGKTPEMFYQHVADGWAKLEKYVQAQRLRLLIVATTFGPADAMIVWQAKDPEATKAFRDNVLAGNGHHSITTYAMSSDGGGHWK